MAVHRPLAEQLVGLAVVAPGERVLELVDGDDELTGRLRAAVGAEGTVEVAARPWHLTQPPGRFDLAACLLAIDTQLELHEVLPQLAVVAHRALVAVWGGGATYDNALRAAWRDVSGADPPALHHPDPVNPPSGWRQRRVSDVARFDGVDQLLTALTDERDIAPAGLDRAALRDRLAHHLARFTAHDGTMRIPVRATVVERAGRPPRR